MGEFADMAVDESLEMLFQRHKWKNGDMTDEDAYEMGIIDEMGFEEGDY